MIKAVGIYLSANILNALVPLMLMPVLTRILTVSEYGEVAIFISVVGFFSALVGTTFVGSVGRKFFDADISSKEYSGYVAAAISLGALGSILVLSALQFFDETLSNWFEIQKYYLYAALAVAFFGFIIQINLNQYQIRKAPKSYSKLQISWTVTNALLSLGAVVLLGLGADGRVGAQVFSAFSMMLVASYVLLTSGRLNFVFLRLSYFREIILFGLPLMPHVIGGYLLNSVDRVVIGSQIDLKAAGLYAVAFQLSAGAGLIFDALNKAWQPWLFETLNKKDRILKAKVIRYTYAWFLLLFIGCFFVSFFADWLIVFVAGEKYLGAGDVFLVLVWAQLFKGMYFGVVNYCFYAKRTGWLSLSSVVSGCMQIAFLFLLVSSLGLIGAGFAYLISMTVRFLLTWYISIRVYEMPWFDFALLFSKAK